ncbi:MAG: endonuclease MutS2, partial [Alistipes sp.]|nr:endonuclease MutS2 [Alistipes sp.]
MIYPATFEQKIGFDRLREQVAARCTMASARRLIADEGFSTSPREIEQRLTLADEMRSLRLMEYDFPGGDYPDIEPLVQKMRIEGTFLDVAEVATLGRALRTIGAVVRFVEHRQAAYPSLYRLSRG